MCMVTGTDMTMSADHSDDPWMLREGMPGAGLTAEPTQPALRVETIEGVEPLDAQLGVFPKKTVPDVLYDALFGQPEPTEAEIEAAGGDLSAVPPMQTYAILEAARVMNLPELLGNSGLEHRCLFKGDAYDELKDVAPWIVRLEEGSSFTRNLFSRSDAYWHLWDSEPGIYIRSRGTLDELWRHFRKFTKIQDESGKWYFLRFWDAEFFSSYMQLVAGEPIAIKWVRSLISSFVLVRSDIATVVHRNITSLSDEHEDIIRRPVVLDSRQRDFFRRSHLMNVSSDIYSRLVSVFKDRLPSLAGGGAALNNTILKMDDLGFKKMSSLEILAAWAVFFGDDFASRDPSGELMNIIRSTDSEDMKISRLKSRMRQLRVGDHGAR